MVEIVPAILSQSLADIEEHLLRVRGAVRRVQIDLVDGAYARNSTWPYTTPQTFARIVSQEEGMPLWEEFDFEFDIMAMHPERDVENFVQAGASSVIIHADSSGAHAALTLLGPLRGGELGIEVGIALSSSASAQNLEPFEGMFDYVQVMGIARVGFQGEAFDERTLAVVTQIRHTHPNVPIQVDGGVRSENARALARAGATRLVVGSAIFNEDDPKRALEALYTIANAQ